MGQTDFPLPGHVYKGKCVCEKDGMGELIPCLHCDQREWHTGTSSHSDRKCWMEREWKKIHHLCRGNTHRDLWAPLREQN